MAYFFIISDEDDVQFLPMGTQTEASTTRYDRCEKSQHMTWEKDSVEDVSVHCDPSTETCTSGLVAYRYFGPYVTLKYTSTDGDTDSLHSYNVCGPVDGDRYGYYIEGNAGNVCPWTYPDSGTYPCDLLAQNRAQERFNDKVANGEIVPSATLTNCEISYLADIYGYFQGWVESPETKTGSEDCMSIPFTPYPYNKTFNSYLEWIASPEYFAATANSVDCRVDY